MKDVLVSKVCGLLRVSSKLLEEFWVDGDAKVSMVSIGGPLTEKALAPRSLSSS